MDNFFSIFHNSEFQSVFLSPLMGAIFAILLTRLSATTSIAPQTVLQTIVIYKSVVQQNNITVKGTSKSNSNDDPSAYLVLYIASIVSLAWAYLKFAPIIFFWVKIFTTTGFIFSFTVIAVTSTKQMFRDRSWQIHVFLPFILMCFSMLLVYILHKNIDVALVQVASQMNPMEFVVFLFKNLNQNSIIFFSLQAIGLTLTTFFQFMCLANFIFYISLMNYYQAEGRRKSFWYRLIRIMDYFVSTTPKRNIFTLIILGILAFVFVNGHVSDFIFSFSLK